MPGRKIRDADDARACLESVEASGLDRVRWAHDHDVDARSLNAWRVNLAQRERQDTPKTLRLVELVPTPPRGREHSGIRICRGPWTVEVEPDFDPAVLVDVLAAVAQC